MSLDPELWHRLSPHLDRALTLDENERARWLAELEDQDQALAAHLRALLAEHHALDREGFLEQRPPTPLQSPATAGDTAGPYHLIAPIGYGGMGTVWLAERSDGRFDRRVAIKFPNISVSGHAQERFQREGSLLGRLVHPHIAQLLDAGVTDAGRPYLVLEHVEGEPIDRYCDQRALGVEARLRLFLKVLDAVAHAHANLVVHRDLKPSNVLVTGDGGVKLLDFGIAKLLDEESAGLATLLTQQGGVAMTPEYAAPEQMTGGPVTTATDVYALGVLLYVLLTGQHPAGAARRSPAELIKAVVDTEPAPPSDLVTRLGRDPQAAAPGVRQRGTTPEKLARLLRGDLDTIILKGLKKVPQERYSSVATLAQDLRRYLAHEPISARPDTLFYTASKFVRRNRLPVALASLALLAVLAGVVGTLAQAYNARVQRDFALRQLARAETINDLNQFVLSDAAPGGQSFTVNQLLERAERVVARQGGREHVERADLLIAIGRQYWAQDENDRALRVLHEAYELSRRLPDLSSRGRAACALASALARGEEMERAETLVQEGLRQLPAQPQFILDRVFCLQCGSEVARETGASSEAIARIEQAQLLLQQSPFQSELMRLSVLMERAESYRIAGRLHEASAAFAQASEVMTELGRDGTEKAATLFNNWGVALTFLGRPLEGEEVLRRAIEIGRDERGEENVSPMVLVNYARVVRNLGHPAQAADYGARAYRKGQQAGHQVVVNQALLERARAHLDLGDAASAQALLDEVELRLRRALPPGHIAFAALAADRSRLAQAGGDLRAAHELAAEALAIIERLMQAGQVAQDFLPPFLLRRAEVHLLAQRLEEARADADRTLAILEQTFPPQVASINLGRAFLMRARVLRAQGDHAAAAAVLRSALQHLEEAAGPDHPDARTARELLASTF